MTNHGLVTEPVTRRFTASLTLAILNDFCEMIVLTVEDLITDMSSLP